MSLRALAAVLLASALVITGCQGSSLRVVGSTAASKSTIELRRLQMSPGTAFEGMRVHFNRDAEIFDPLPAQLWPLPVSATRAEQIARDHGAQGDLTCRAGLLTNTQIRRAGRRLIVRRPVWLCFALSIPFPIMGPGSGGTFLADELVWIDAVTGRRLYTASAS